MNIYFVSSGFGTDAPGWYIGSDGKIHRIPGWNPEAMVDFSHAIKIIREAGQLKQAGLREATIKSVMEFAQKEFGQYIKDGGVVVIG